MRTFVLTLAALCVLAGPQSSAGQSRTFDSVAGEYVITYYSHSLGRDTIIRIEPPNKIEPILTLDSVAILSGGMFEYRYSILNGDGTSSTQNVAQVEMACSTSATVSVPTGWLGRTGANSARLGSPYCSFLTDGGVAPGGSSSGFVVEAPAVLAIDSVVAMGPRPPVDWPDSGEHDEAVHELVSEVRGLTGGWVALAGPVAMITPSVVDLSLVGQQAGAVCSDPLWIDDSALCDAISDSLTAAGASLASGDTVGARATIGAVSSMVFSNRQPFGQVENNARWVLTLNLGQLLDNLPVGLSTWAASVAYTVGDEVSHQGLDYRCRQSHTSQTGWEPPNVYALWERINTGGLWAAQVLYQTDDEAEYGGIVYRAIQGHQSQAGWEPPNQPALWTPVS